MLAPSWEQEQDNRFMPSHPDMNTAHLWHVPFCSYSQSTWFSVASADMARVQSVCLWKQKKECVKRLRLQPRKTSLSKSLRWNHVFMQSIWRGMRRDRNFPFQWADKRRIQYWSCRLVVGSLVFWKEPEDFGLKRVFVEEPQVPDPKVSLSHSLASCGSLHHASFLLCGQPPTLSSLWIQQRSSTKQSYFKHDHG